MPILQKDKNAIAIFLSIASLSKKGKISGAIGVSVALVGIAGTCLLINDYSKTHRIDLSGYDTSDWKNRYELLNPDEKITPKSFSNLYVSPSAYGLWFYREWAHTEHNSDSPTVAFDKKFVNKIMERRFAHLQQCIYYIKLYENEIRKRIDLGNLSEDAVWKPNAVREFDEFMDQLIKILNTRPAAIPNLKFSDELLQKAEAMINEDIRTSERGVYQVAEGSKNEKLMLVLRKKFLNLKDKSVSYKAVKKFKDCPTSNTKKINWEKETEIAVETGKSECTNNEFYVYDDYYNDYLIALNIIMLQKKL